MTCKNCIHYEVCEDHYRASVLDFINGSCINFEEAEKALKEREKECRI